MGKWCLDYLYSVWQGQFFCMHDHYIEDKLSANSWGNAWTVACWTESLKGA